MLGLSDSHNRSTETRNVAEKVTEILVRRCVRTLQHPLNGFSPVDTQDIADEIVANLIERIIEPSDNLHAPDRNQCQPAPVDR